jgi:hypothetical protein
LKRKPLEAAPQRHREHRGQRFGVKKQKLKAKSFRSETAEAQRAQRTAFWG